MKNRKNIVIVGLFIVGLVSIIGATFAYFTALITGDESSYTLTVSGGTLAITVNGGANINVQNVIPSPEAKAIKVITLTGTNTTDLIMPYSLRLVIENNTFGSNSLTYTLDSENTDDNGIITPSIMSPTGIVTGQSYIDLGNGYFTKGNSLTHTYTLKLYFNETEENQNEEQGKVINGYVTVIGDIPATPES